MNSSIIEMINSDEKNEHSNQFLKIKPENEKSDNYRENNEFSGDITKGVAKLIWQESSQRAKIAYHTYTNIDILRPYFDVEPIVVKQRLISSIVPVRLFNIDMNQISRELYGPNMIVLSLVAMLLMQMKTANISLKEGTLMGSSFGICFGYWIFASAVIWFICYIFNIQLAILQSLHLIGYGLFGPCIVIFATTVIHPESSHLFFYTISLLFVSLSVFKMTLIMKIRYSNKKSLFFFTIIAYCLQFLFLCYLHFSYHDNNSVQFLKEEFFILTPLQNADIFTRPFKEKNSNVLSE